jgi:hypothetical protein
MIIPRLLQGEGRTVSAAQLQPGFLSNEADTGAAAIPAAATAVNLFGCVDCQRPVFTKVSSACSVGCSYNPSAVST